MNQIKEIREFSHLHSYIKRGKWLSRSTLMTLRDKLLRMTTMVCLAALVPLRWDQPMRNVINLGHKFWDRVRQSYLQR